MTASPTSVSRHARPLPFVLAVGLTALLITPAANAASPAPQATVRTIKVHVAGMT